MDVNSVVESTTGSSESTVDGNATGAEQVTLEQEVKQLVGSVSSWWTDFSKRSQEQLISARKEIESQGGLVSIAKKEAQKFEAQLSEAQKAARERAQAGEDDSVARSSQGKQDDPDKGKQREEVVEGDDGAAVEDLEERATKKGRSNSKSEPMITSTGEAIFDVDADITEEEKVAMDHTIQTAKQNAQTALHNVQSFWDRLQADPRLNNIQSSIAKTLKNASLPKGADGKDASEGEDVTAKTLPASFSDVTKQFQASFPHLNWKESQALAKKYYDASENVARDWGKEMSTLMGDLVKIVPPEEQPHSEKTDVKVKTETTALPTATTEEDDFDWDGDMDTQSNSTGLQTTSGPETTSWEGGTDSSTHLKADGTESQAGAKKSKESEKGNNEDDDEESDWE